MRKYFVCAVVALSLAFAAQRSPRGGIFARDNLVAWCIVPFDAKQRGPAERADMLARLGIRMLAYDWRAKDIPTFDQEFDELTRRKIKLQAFWLSSGLTPQRDANVAAVLDFLKRRSVKTELWYSVSTPKEFASLSQDQKIAAVAESVGYVAREARKLGCKVGIYNHGGWTGEPENQIEVIRRLGLDNVGIVYNFHHGREHMARFPDLFARMLPHLYAVNLNGMKDKGPMILPIGQGDREFEMIRTIRNSGYRGPIGILNHRTEVDAETGLRQNIDGLQKVLTELGDKPALATYRKAPK
jgi:sugar phosphate isomerase/epimerase